MRHYIFVLSNDILSNVIISNVTRIKYFKYSHCKKSHYKYCHGVLEIINAVACALNIIMIEIDYSMFINYASRVIRGATVWSITLEASFTIVICL
jgi:hypothetical protein